MLIFQFLFFPSIGEILSICCENCNLYHVNPEFKLLTLNELVAIVKSLDNKLKSHEIINARILKNIDSMVHILLHFVNTSMEYGNFPNII